MWHNHRSVFQVAYQHPYHCCEHWSTRRVPTAIIQFHPTQCTWSCQPCPMLIFTMVNPTMRLRMLTSQKMKSNRCISFPQRPPRNVTRSCYFAGLEENSSPLYLLYSMPKSLCFSWFILGEASLIQRRFLCQSIKWPFAISIVIYNC